MAHKQIIIDGIDVSGCEFYFDEKCRCMNASIMQDFYSCPQCNSNPNCYYKQLKRKEQEVQQAMDNYVQLDLQRVKEYNELVDLYKAKEQECEALQMSENEAGEIIAELQAYKDVNEDFKTAWKELKRKEQEYNKLYIQLKADEEYHKEEENTLRKIIKNKEERNIELYKENNKLKQTLSEIKEICKAESYLSPQSTILLVYDILQKISEVENANI